jgi:predicted RNA-binding protein with RPS1 domain
VHEGDPVEVRIIRIDPERRRVGLSMRQASDEAYMEVDWRDEAVMLDEEELQPAEQGEAELVA